jgi:hypothetical protein
VRRCCTPLSQYLEHRAKALISRSPPWMIDCIACLLHSRHLAHSIDPISFVQAHGESQRQASQTPMSFMGLGQEVTLLPRRMRCSIREQAQIPPTSPGSRNGRRSATASPQALVPEVSTLENVTISNALVTIMHIPPSSIALSGPRFRTSSLLPAPATDLSRSMSKCRK